MNLESLLKLAGERDQPSADGMTRARLAARRSWQRAVAAHRGGRAARSRRWWGVALAATVSALVLAMVFTMSGHREPAAPTVVARVVNVVGEAFLDPGPVSAATQIRAGDMVSTGDGRLALTVQDALSLRLAPSTRLRFDDAGHVTLEHGALYVDSGGLTAGVLLRIETPAGTVRHVGTQYQVRVDGSRTVVQVREGRVVLGMSRGSTVDLAAGDLADVRDASLRVDHGLPSHGDAWAWAAMLDAGFDTENRPLSEFLAWLAREHGWQLRYASAEAASRAREIRLHGSMGALDAGQMLTRVSLITGIPVVAEGGELWVGRAP